LLSSDESTTQTVKASDLATPINRGGNSQSTNNTEAKASEATVASDSTAKVEKPAATVEAAKKESNSTPKETQSVVVSEWQRGLASAYGPSNAGTYTATGVMLTDNSAGVAVPAGKRYLLGKTVEIQYNGMTITAVVNDTGGLAGGSRALDLQPGVWKAFGFTSENQWGVRYVSWRVVD
jgi:rare lipoprotein A (peptidoglycan hydrolase)